MKPLIVATVAVAGVALATHAGASTSTHPLVTRANVCSDAMPGAHKYRDPHHAGCLCQEPDHPGWLPPVKVHGKIDMLRTDQWGCADSFTAGVKTGSQP